MTHTYSVMLMVAFLLGGIRVATAEGFSTVLNVPSGSLDSLPLLISPGPVFHYVSSGTQVNLTERQPTDLSFIEVREGGELNHSAKGLSSTARGGVINLLDGGEADFLTAVSGGKVNVLGGNIKTRLVVGDGEAKISGGIVRDLIVTGEGGHVLVEGGTVLSSLHVGFEGDSRSIPVETEVSITGGNLNFSENLPRNSLLVGNKGTLNISGGNLLFEEVLTGIFYPGSHVNFFGYDFAIDGVPMSSFTSGAPIEIFDRDIVLSGRLRDGSPFSLPLSSQNPHNAVLAFPDSHVTLNYVIPEPGTCFLLLLAGTSVAMCTQQRL